MSRMRRVFDKCFVAKINLIVLKEKGLSNILVNKYNLLPTQIYVLKTDVDKSFTPLFNQENGAVKIEYNVVYQIFDKIRLLTLESNFLKKMFVIK